jgi:hypothetical protein
VADDSQGLANLWMFYRVGVYELCRRSVAHVVSRRPCAISSCSLVLPGQVLEEDMPIAKAACFMASSSRIDERNSLRMYVFRKEAQPVKLKKKGKPEVCYFGRPINITEREIMMGYPTNYVKAPGKRTPDENMAVSNALCH